MDSEKRQLRDIFDQASEMANWAERRAFVHRACGGDEAMRHEIEELLEAHDRAGKLFDQMGPASRPAEAGEPPSPEERIGGYKLLQKIGEGGCGVVYLAEQDVPVRRRVALKVIKLGMDTDRVIARFEAERQALALMDHPNIARVLDAGATERGRPYFVMELVRGAKITSFCDQKNLSTSERLELFMGVCQAVQHAHQKGVIHRDLKPSNILVTLQDGVTPVPKIIDFGIAKATTDLRLTDRTLFTQFELLIGTPAYMSPEQAELNSADIDTRSDIYSLGVLLYELLTGRTPFDTETLLKSGLDELRRTIREAEPARPSTRVKTLAAADLTEVARRRQVEPVKLSSLLRGDLDWIVLKALAKDRRRRYETASALAMDVQRYLASEPVVARPPSAAYVFSKWSRRHRAAYVGSAVVLTVLLLGIVASSWQAVRATRAERDQRELRKKSDADRAAADAARNEALTRAYAADMKAVSIAIAEGNFGQANALLDRHLPAVGQPDVRGVEWSVLRSRAIGDEIASFDQPGINAGVALAPDNSWAVAGAKFGDVCVWDTATGRLLQRFPALTRREPRRGVAVSPDGRQLAYLSDASIRVRQTDSWELLREIPCRASVIHFAPDGRLVWGDFDGVHFLKVHTFAKDFDLPTAALDDASLLSFTADGSRLAVKGSRDAVFEVWEVSSRARLRHLDFDNLIAAAISPDGRFAAMGTSTGRLYLWDWSVGTKIAQTEAHAAWLMDVAFSPDSKRLLSAGGDQTVRLWDLTAAEPLAKEAGSWRGHWNEVWNVAFSSNGQRFITGGKDAKVKLWNAQPPGRRVTEVKIPAEAVHAGFFADGSRFRIKLPDRIRFFSVSNGAPAGEWRIPADYQLQHEYWAGDRLLMCARDGRAVMHGMPDGERLQQIPCKDRPAVAVAGLSSDSRTLATLRQGSAAIDLWNFQTGAHLDELPGYHHRRGTPVYNRVSFSPDGQRVAYTAVDTRVNIFDIPRRTVVHQLGGFTWHLYGAAWSPDGRVLVTSSWDASVVVWNPDTGTPALPALRGHFSGVPTLTFSSDSRTLVTHGGERTIRFWNLATGTEMLTLNDANALWACPISADGRTLLWRRSSDETFLVEHMAGSVATTSQKLF